MYKITITTLIAILLFNIAVLAQPCSLPGMTPSSAIPVCGTAVFAQASVTNCTGPDIAARGCTAGVTSSKSFWYKFTCFQSGTLGFLITGRSNTDDYDWSLLDITGRNPNDVFFDNSLQVSLNIYGTSGNGAGAPFPNSPTGCRPGATGDV
ncbi:MAG: PKD domain-containing protein, partial [Chitinophagaceae bacterium]